LFSLFFQFFFQFFFCPPLLILAVAWQAAERGEVVRAA
jgi:hypothetical protein